MDEPHPASESSGALALPCLGRSGVAHPVGRVRTPSRRMGPPGDGTPGGGGGHGLACAWLRVSVPSTGNQRAGTGKRWHAVESSLAHGP